MRKLTTEEFIDKARSIHGGFYDYSKVEYTGNKNKVIITCPVHGDFEQTPNSHLQGRGCPKCSESGIQSNTEEFIEKARNIHDNKYDYSKVEYANNSTKVIIVCPNHGYFEQTPRGHLNGKGCPECSGNKKINTRRFIEKAKSIHGDKYDYSKVEYANDSTKVIIKCPIHGDFEQTPNKHLIGRGCIECSGKKKSNTEEFIEKARTIHGDKYDYSKVEYVSNKKKVIISCHNHGDFLQTSADHLSGRGCPECSVEKLGFWNPEYLKKHHSDKTNNPCTLYAIECYSDEERFIKIGITTRTLEERYNSYNTLNGYQYDILYEYHSSLLQSSEMEQEILKQFKEYKYEPMNKFIGSSECLQYTVLNDILTKIKGAE